MTRRTTLAGLGATAAMPCLGFAAMAPGVPLRVGVVGGLGFDATQLSRATRARWGRPAEPVPFTAWGSLADHASADGDGVLDAAVLPAEGAADPLPVPPGLRGTLVLRVARLRTVGVALRHPRSDAVLRHLLPHGPTLTLLAMPPAMLVGNLKAGVIDAAVLLGAEAPSPDEALAGLTVVPLGRDVATALLPRLAIRLRPGAGDREGPST